MNRIDDLFIKVRARKRPALAAYITAGDPDLETTNRVALALCQAGVELLEYGVPFSDPIADGPVIQRASLRSLQSGTTVDAILKNVRALRAAGCEAAISLFGAYNPFFHHGMANICREAKAAGVDGLLIPDLPADEAGEIQNELKASDLRCAFLLAPTSGEDRMKLIAGQSTGYIYCLALRGVTGARAELPPDLGDFLKRIRKVTDQPLLVGFGISTPEQMRTLAPLVDAVVVGSAFVKIMEEHGRSTDLPERMASYARSLIAGWS